MNYIYDIFLNLNEILYDSFDWNKCDKLLHIKKIPLFKINEKDFRKIISHNIKVEQSFLDKIKGKTDIWNYIDKPIYAVMLSDNNNIVAIEFNDKGISIKKSYLLIEEELEVLEIVNRFKNKSFNYDLLNTCYQTLKTRKQHDEEAFIKKELDKLDDEKLNYLYFELFEKQYKNKLLALKNIKKIINNKTNEKYKNLYDILKLTSTNTNKML